MRAMTATTAIVLASTIAFSGCRSGSGWGWNRNSNAALAKSDPALPSAGAAPTVDYANAYSSATAPQVEAGSAFAAPPANSYAGTPYPDGSAAPAATPYGAPEASTAVAPQQGSYADSYGAPPANPGGYPSTATPDAYAPPGADAVASYGAAPTSPHAAAGDPYGAPAPPAANPYDAGQAPASYPATATPFAAQPEYAAAQSYGANQAAEPYNSMPSASPSGSGYQPGHTDYTPGNTGYAPPGVPQYEMPAQPNVVATRNEPHFRPGGTSDYLPQTQTPAAVADRYGNPAAAYSQPSPYMAPDGSNSPARGYTQ